MHLSHNNAFVTIKKALKASIPKSISTVRDWTFETCVFGEKSDNDFVMTCTRPFSNLVPVRHCLRHCMVIYGKIF